MIQFNLDPSDASGAPASSFAVSVIGVGGSGSNVIDKIALEGMPGADLVSMNCDARALSTSTAGTKLQLGRELTQGLGCGGDPELGAEAAACTADAIRTLLEGRKMVFICAGLGGGTGSGAAPAIARMAREAGAFVVVFATLPFAFEGRRRSNQAGLALQDLRKYANALITFENDRMGELVVPKKGVQEAFELADKIIGQSVRAITSLVTQPGLIHIGMDDLVTALRNTDSRCLFGYGQAKGENRAVEALSLALRSPLLDRGQMLSGARNVLVHICGGTNLTLFEIETLMRELGKHVHEDAQILFGAANDARLQENLGVTILTSLSKPAAAPRTEAASSITAPVPAPEAESPAAGGAVEVIEIAPMASSAKAATPRPAVVPASAAAAGPAPAAVQARGPAPVRAATGPVGAPGAALRTPPVKAAAGAGAAAPRAERVPAARPAPQAPLFADAEELFPETVTVPAAAPVSPASGTEGSSNPRTVIDIPAATHRQVSPRRTQGTANRGNRTVSPPPEPEGGLEPETGVRQAFGEAPEPESAAAADPAMEENGNQTVLSPGETEFCEEASGPAVDPAVESWQEQERYEEEYDVSAEQAAATWDPEETGAGSEVSAGGVLEPAAASLEEEPFDHTQEYETAESGERTGAQEIPHGPVTGSQEDDEGPVSRAVAEDPGDYDEEPPSAGEQLPPAITPQAVPERVLRIDRVPPPQPPLPRHHAGETAGPVKRFALSDLIQRDPKPAPAQAPGPARTYPAAPAPDPAPDPAPVPAVQRAAASPVRPVPVNPSPVRRAPDFDRVTPIRPIPAGRAVMPGAMVPAPAPAPVPSRELSSSPVSAPVQASWQPPAASPFTPAPPREETRIPVRTETARTTLRAAPAGQQTFDERLQPASSGTRFDRVKPTVEEGEDLDVPTFLRRKR